MDGDDTFYDLLAPVYELVYPDWEGQMQAAGALLDALVRAEADLPGRTVLDATCCTGVHALGLATRGYTVTANDRSPGAIARAQVEAQRRGLAVDWQVGDVRALGTRYAGRFAVVISADNALPHLPDDGALAAAIDSLVACAAPGGLILVTLRDFAAEPPGRHVIAARTAQLGDTTWTVLQTQENRPDASLVTLQVRAQRGQEPPNDHCVLTRYFPVSLARVQALLATAGCVAIRRVPSAYPQPVLLARRPATGAPPAAT